MKIAVIFLILCISFSGFAQGPDTLSHQRYEDRERTWQYSKSELLVRRADSALKIINPVTGAQVDMFNYVSPEMFGAKGDGITDDGPALQQAVDFCLRNQSRPLPLVLSARKYHIEQDIVINVRDTNVKFNPAQLVIRGAAGAGQPSGGRLGSTIERGGNDPGGTIFRICETSDGDYPGGGRSHVLNPLNFLRSVVITDINFVGSDADPLRFSGIAGRGIFSSTIERCNFSNLKYGIRFGKGKTGVATERSDKQGIDLDYCERNRIVKCNFRKVQFMITILNGDISKIEQNFMSGTVDSSGYIMYLAGGNDFYDVSNNIIHPRVASSNERINRAIIFYYLRGVDFRNNHFEDIHSNLFYCLGSIEVFNCSSNLIYGVDTAIQSVFSLKMAEKGVVNINENNMAFPDTKGHTISVSVAGDDEEKSKLRQIRLSCTGNRFTTRLGGNINGKMKTSMDAIGNSYGQFANPLVLGSAGYLWADRSGNLRYKKSAGGAPRSDNDGSSIPLEEGRAQSTMPGKRKHGISYQHTGSISLPYTDQLKTVKVTLPEKLPNNHYQVHITPTAPLGTFYVSEKTKSSFTVHLMSPAALTGLDISFDWLITLADK